MYSGATHIVNQKKAVQCKLAIGQPNDRYEQEADAVADQVMKMPATQIPPVQRKCKACEEEEVQMKPLSQTITPVLQKQEEEEEEVRMKPLATSITPIVQKQSGSGSELQMKGISTDTIIQKEDEPTSIEATSPETEAPVTSNNTLPNLTLQVPSPLILRANGVMFTNPTFLVQGPNGSIVDLAPYTGNGLVDFPLAALESLGIPILSYFHFHMGRARQYLGQHFDSAYGLSGGTSFIRNALHYGYISADDVTLFGAPSSYNFEHYNGIPNLNIVANPMDIGTMINVSYFNYPLEEGHNNPAVLFTITAPFDQNPFEAFVNLGGAIGHALSGDLYSLPDVTHNYPRFHDEPNREIGTPTTTTQISPKADSNVSPSKGFESRLNAQKGGGQALPSSTREFMEQRIGADFSEVNIHTGTHATALNRDLGARAFTNANDIYFNQGQYSPHSSEGKRLLAHELTHVVQQNANRTPYLINKYEDEWEVPRVTVRASLSGLTFRLEDATLSSMRTYRQMFHAAILRKLIGSQYSEGLENDIPQNGEFHGIWSDPNASPVNAQQYSSNITLHGEAGTELLDWLERNDYNITGLTPHQRELLHLGEVTRDLHIELEGDLPPWLTTFIFQRLMSRQGALLSEYTSDWEEQRQQAEEGIIGVTACYGEGCLNNRILAQLNPSINVLEAIRNDFVLSVVEETRRFYELIWNVPEEGIPTAVRDQMLASRFLLFCYSQSDFSERALTEHDARIEIINRFMNIALPQQLSTSGDEIISERPSEYNTPEFPSHIRSYPALLPPRGFAQELPLAFGVIGTDYDFSMNLVHRNYLEALGAYFSYTYQWEFSRVPLNSFLSENESEDETPVSGSPTVLDSIVSGVNRSLRYRDQDYETVDDELGIFSPFTYSLVELNSALGLLGATVVPFIGRAVRPRHEQRFNFREPGVYFVSCVAYSMTRDDNDAVVRVPSSAIYSFPIFVNGTETISETMLASTQAEVVQRHHRILEIQDQLDNNRELSTTERRSLQAELRNLQILNGFNVEEELTVRRDSIIRAIFQHEKDRIMRLSSSSRSEIQERLTSINTALEQNRAFADSQVTLARSIMEERSEISRTDRAFYAPLRQSLSQMTQVMEVQDRRGLVNAQRVRAWFIGDEGATISLVIEYVHDEDENEYHISDITTPNSGDTSIEDDATDDSDTPPVVLGIVRLLRSTAGYGQRGHVAVEWERERYIREVTADTAVIITTGIDNAVTLIELAALAAAPFTAGASLGLLAPLGVIGAFPAAYRLITRYEDSTFRLDWNSASDIVSVLGGFGEVSRALKIVQVPGRNVKMVLGLGQMGLQGLILGGVTLHEIEQVQASNASLGEKRTQLMLILGHALINFGMLIGEPLMERAYNHRGAPNRPPDSDSSLGVDSDTPALTVENHSESDGNSTETNQTPEGIESDNLPQNVETRPESPVQDGDSTATPDAESSHSESEDGVTVEETRSGPEPSENIPAEESTTENQHEEVVNGGGGGETIPNAESLPPEAAQIIGRLDAIREQFQRMKERVGESNDEMSQALDQYIQDALTKRQEIFNNPESADALGNANDLIDSMREIRDALRGRLNQPEPSEESSSETEENTDHTDAIEDTPEPESPDTETTESQATPDTSPEVVDAAPQTPDDLIGDNERFEGHGQDSSDLNRLFDTYKEGPGREDVTPQEWARRTRGEARRILDRLLGDGWAQRGRRRRPRDRGDVVVTVTRRMLEAVPYPHDDVSIPIPISPGDSLVIRPTTDRPSTSTMRRLFMDVLGLLPSDIRASFDAALRDTLNRYSMDQLREMGYTFRDYDGVERAWPLDAHDHPLEVHHIIELSWGGTNAPSNLMPLPSREHDLLSRWWRGLQRHVLGNGEIRDARNTPDTQGEHIPDLLEILNTEPE
ncbi:eCIS core domain-containing protein [Pseudozobellia thermophila]|uniref:HNH nuclease domain-containing protein n=1 Tax=Pseudozobellia thermophila TaxID=192903 RepID=A0A1M6M6K9_9FLAO|nr:DUF4157 domain-containing protein [Pseudozobellia thermophila]SHJ78903.1 protein of unknown function [Pseudozobellia thermophila]